MGNLWSMFGKEEEVPKPKPEPEPEPPKPWRAPPFDDWSQRSLVVRRRQVENYKTLGNTLGIEDINFMLVGAQSCGKSSTINTLETIFHNTVQHRLHAGSAIESLTTKPVPYRLRPQPSDTTREMGTPFPFVLWDTRGLEDGNTTQVDFLSKMLEGKIKANGNATKERRHARPKHQMHVLVLVCDGMSIVNAPSHEAIEKMRDLRVIAERHNIPVVALMTKADLVCPVVKSEGAGMVFYSKPVGDAVRELSNLLGLPGGQIIPVRNYDEETEVNTNINLLSLIALKKMLELADARLRTLADMKMTEMNDESDDDEEGSDDGNSPEAHGGTGGPRAAAANNLNM